VSINDQSRQLHSTEFLAAEASGGAYELQYVDRAGNLANSMP
jgi:hypothetical protein